MKSIDRFLDWRHRQPTTHHGNHCSGRRRRKQRRWRLLGWPKPPRRKKPPDRASWRLPPGRGKRLRRGNKPKPTLPPRRPRSEKRRSWKMSRRPRLHSSQLVRPPFLKRRPPRAPFLGRYACTSKYVVACPELARPPPAADEACCSCGSA